MTKPLAHSASIDNQNMNPNRVDFGSADLAHMQATWAEEMRRADERALRFKQEFTDSEKKRMDLDMRFKEMERAVSLREQEIQRLSLLYKGGQNFDTVKVNFDR